MANFPKTVSKETLISYQDSVHESKSKVGYQTPGSSRMFKN